MAGKNYFEMIRDGILVDGSGGGDAPAPVLITKGVTTNGTYSAADDEADGYSTVSVDVPNSYTAQDEGKVVQSGALVSQTATSTTTNGTIDTTTNDSVVVNVANSYVAGDEGKVVSNGALVTQGSDSTTANGTFDTTMISSFLVNVPSSGGDFAKLTPVNTTDFESDDLYIYIPANRSIGFVFGQLTTNHRPSSYDSTAEFSLPASFPISKIGSSINGIRTSPRSSYSKSISIGKTESTIKLTAGAAWFDDSESNPYTLVVAFTIVT